MFEILQDFEQAAGQFSPVVLIGPAVAAVLLGLFVWLAGLRFRRVLVAVIGAVAGGICGFFMTGRNMILAALSAGVAGIIAVILEKIVIAIIAGGLAAAFSFAVLVNVCKRQPQQAIPSQSLVQNEMPNQAEHYDINQTLTIIKAYAVDFWAELKAVGSQMPAYSWVVVTALGVIFVAAGLYLWPLTSALCFAALGTLSVFAGMIALLLYKGAQPISHIGRNQSFYAAVFVAMIAFGTIMQLLFCQCPKGKPIREEQADRERLGKQSLDWRTK